MRLCPDNADLPDALEQIGAVVAFMGEAICCPRERPWENASGPELWGAQIIFDALQSELTRMREALIQQYIKG
jgi:hypothetical protein